MKKLSIIYSRATIGMQAPLVTVETHITKGLPGLNIVGLPETAVKESKDRVKSAILNSGFDFPICKIVINLAPADLPKEGARFDLPIALGILAASKQIKSNLFTQYEFAGELALTGKLRPIKNALPIALGTRTAKRNLIIPTDNAYQASLPQDNIVFPADNLTDVCHHLENIKNIPIYKNKINYNKKTNQIDLADIYGQPHAKRAIEIAAAGNHNILLSGPPGTGKTMLANSITSILPPLGNTESLTTAAIYSLKNSLSAPAWKTRPFRAPHHSASQAAIIGGGTSPKPGEISLAHNGVLFLDEIAEFKKDVLESLREPLENKKITISRANNHAEFPAKFQLVAAMNPCPCGNLGNFNKSCNCSEQQIKRYQNKLSGPLLDRIDLHVDVPLLTRHQINLLKNTKTKETSEKIQDKIIQCYNIQLSRQDKHNSNLTNKEIELYCKLDKFSIDFLTNAMEKLSLSLRSYFRILRVARTIADLNNEENILLPHITEALSFRKK